MNGDYTYHGDGQDHLTPGLDLEAPDYPIPTTYTRPYTEWTAPASCALGQHYAHAVTGRDGAWFWACYHCPATREQADPTWRTP